MLNSGKQPYKMLDILPKNKKKERELILKLSILDTKLI